MLNVCLFACLFFVCLFDSFFLCIFVSFLLCPFIHLFLYLFINFIFVSVENETLHCVLICMTVIVIDLYFSSVYFL